MNTVVETSIDHIAYVAANMRKSDVDEIWSSDHTTPMQALNDGFARSEFCRTIYAKGRPIAIFGVAPLADHMGVPWLLGTDEIGNNQKFFLSITKPQVDDMLDYRPKLANFVHVDNKRSVRWLRFAGFNIEKPEVYGAEQEMFHPFWRIKEGYE